MRGPRSANPEYFNARDISLFFGFSSVAIIALRSLARNINFRLGVYRLLLLVTLLPWYAHFLATRTNCAGWGCGEPDVVPRQGLLLFGYVSPTVIFVLFLFFVWLAQRRPQSAALFPIVTMIAELIALRLLEWRSPADYVYMNAAADRWLIVSSLAATAGLACYAWFPSLYGAEDAV